MRVKLFLRYFAIVLPVALVAGFVNEIGNDLDWQWGQWRVALTPGNILGSVFCAIVITALLVGLEPRSGAL